MYRRISYQVSGFKFGTRYFVCKNGIRVILAKTGNMAADSNVIELLHEDNAVKLKIDLYM